MRYIVKWDERRGGYSIWDLDAAAWTEQPAFGLEHVAQTIADALDLKARLQQQQHAQDVEPPPQPGHLGTLSAAAPAAESEGEL